MPGLQFEDLPAAQVKEINYQLQAQWKIEADALNKSWFPSRGKFETAKAKLNAKYQQQELTALTKLQQQVQEQQRVQQLIKQGTEGLGREQEAGLRMRLGPEAERLVFPKLQYLTPAYLRSTGFMENISGFGEAAESEPSFWLPRGKEKKIKESLIDQYLRWRQSELYDTKTIPEKQQLDREWDMLMFSNGRFDEWWENKEQRQPAFEARALRTPGKIAETMRKKVVNVTPIGRSFIGKTYGTKKQMMERYGFKERSQPTELPRPTTEEAYNAVPSGTQYMGTDGRIRTKR